MRNLVIFTYLVIKVIVLDQFTKVSAMYYFEHTKDPHIMLPFLNIIEAYNYGMSFGILSSYQQYSNIFFIMISSIIITLCFLFYLSENNFLNTSCFGFIIGGAIGNIIDRVRVGAVFDFIDFHVYGWHYPAFNFADAAIVTGAILLIAAQFEFFNRKL